MTIKKIYLFLLSFFMIGCLSACSSSAPNHTVTSTKSRAGLYSNTLLSPSDIQASAYFPLNKTLVANIRAVGGEVYQSGSFVTVVLPADALFEPATSVLQPHAEDLMIDVAKIIARFPSENVIITTHTDNMGASFSQAKLTRDQAQLFAMILWQQDSIDLKTFQRFKYAGMGDTQPITDDPTAYGQSLNRRIQVTIYPSQDMAEAYRALGNPDLHQI
jgi:outer membrane protein OmpA-like peptidoglycan-associated protein